MDLSRISLRPLRLTDVDDFMVWASDETAVRFSKTNPFTSKEDGFRYLKEEIIPQPWRRSICFDDRSIGIISLYPGCGQYIFNGNIGYGLATQYWGQEIMTVAVKMALSLVFSEFPLIEWIQALVEKDNKASQRGIREGWVCERTNEEIFGS